MARITPAQLRAIVTRHTKRPPRVFVETGTFKGKTTRFALSLGLFEQVHTIEIHDGNYQLAVEQLQPLGVQCHHGDSADVLPQLAREISRPCVFFLDAHWGTTSPDMGGADKPLPLWVELDAIAARRRADIVIVDDVKTFGQSLPTPEWENVSLTTIAARFEKRRVIESIIMFDQAVVYLR